jgi:hypothetical protein
VGIPNIYLRINLLGFLGLLEALIYCKSQENCCNFGLGGRIWELRPKWKAERIFTWDLDSSTAGGVGASAIQGPSILEDRYVPRCGVNGGCRDGFSFTYLIPSI